MNISYPFHFDYLGRTASNDDPTHIRDMIEELLFTSPGERVNRPDFGTGILQLIFAPNSEELSSALQFAIQAAIDRWLGDLIEVQALSVTSEDSTLTVSITYAIRVSGQVQQQTFTRGA